MKNKAWVPGAAQYQKINEWDKEKGANKNKFTKSERISLAGEIFKKHEHKEKCSPGPNAYEPEVWKKKAEFKPARGQYHNKGDIIRFAEESQNMYGNIPLGQYETLEMDKIKKKPRYCKIDKLLVRFPDKGKNDLPHPQTYDVQEAVVSS